MSERFNDSFDIDDDGPSDAVLEKQAREEIGFTDEDEPGEEVVVSDADHREVLVVAPVAQKTRDISRDDAEGIKQKVSADTYAAARAAFADGEIGGMPVGEYLAKIGCDSTPPGRSRLWFKSEGQDTGFWLFVIAPKQKDGAMMGGYRVTLAFGREKAGDITLEGCALLNSIDRAGTQLEFNKSSYMNYRDGKFMPGVALNEGELVGRLRDLSFGVNPFIFNEV